MEEVQERFNRLYTQLANELYAYGIALGFEKSVVMDAIHDVYLHVFERNITIDDDKNMKFYLFRSLKNYLISLNRKSVQFEQIDQIDDYEFSLKVSGFEIIEEDDARLELIRRTERMMKHLTNRQREAVFLYFKQELSYEEIAGILHITTKGARKLIYRAIERLREQLLPSGVMFLSLF